MGQVGARTETQLFQKWPSDQELANSMQQNTQSSNGEKSCPNNA